MANAMRKVSLRNLAAHKVRLALTVLSVVLGTSFVAGSIIFTSTISQSFNNIFDKVAIGVDTQITPKSGAESGFGGGQTLGVPDSVLTTIQQDRAALGVNKIVPTYSAGIVLADASGKAVQSGGAPSVGQNWIPTAESLDPGGSTIIAGGQAPSAPDQVLINKSAADKAGLHVGSHTKVVVESGNATPMNVVVVGIVKMVGDTSGYTSVYFDQSTARSLFSDGSHVASIQMSAASGVSPDQLRARIEAKFPGQYTVQTGDQVRQKEKEAVNQFLQIFNYILLAFAGIGLIVGTFIIYNTFSMIVAQRVRELALLRAIGSSRRQVTRSVLLEAFVVGLIGSVVGLVIGCGIAAGLQALLSAQGSGLPTGGLTVTWVPIVSCLAVGIIVTMISAYAPARRASKVSPVEAMRESQTDGAASLKMRTIIGAVLGVLGILALVTGGSGKGGGPAGLVGLGAVLLILAVVFAAPALSRPVVGALGLVLARPFGKLGQLARTNASRNPRRTAATAFALTLGLMLVAVIGTLGSSFKATIDKAISTDVTANLILTSSGQTGGLPSSVAANVAKVDGVGRVVQLSNVPAYLDGRQYVGTSPSGDLSKVFKLTMLQGNSQIGGNSMLVSDKELTSHRWHLGQTVDFTNKFGADAQVQITGVYKQSALAGPYLMGDAAYQKLTPPQLRVAFVLLVGTKPGADQGAVQNSIEEATKDYLTVKVQTRQEYASAQASTINQMLTVLYGMLGLALVIAVLGIINTLALSVVERKREIGMLRAVGMLRGQIRRTIYLESILISIFGALLGMVIGVAIGYALVRTFREWLPSIEAVVPWGTIVFTLVAAAICGLLAALWPAVRAARTKPLEAIADL
ncbi:ABC transporter permease [Rudaeicoccus suwonensis]|uniref:Putative ABC transport system permease protein n=1 Tax=Rudaeicoccus suwonensis TaxID=657409 RepID=A0A561E196_9MICO|nr:FtsX-like permease family protein [Rudaeicoccus suwonensis]TWE09379.1 putative ABC transport system permease protein [Rudaeicoccus suwonensis]